MSDLISRQAAIDALDCINGVEEVLRSLPSAEPTITHEQAIDYLHKTGWLQNHDRILTESKIVPSAQSDVPDIYAGELISRQAAIDAIQKLNIPEDMCVFEIISHIEVEIATLPSAQPDHNAEVSKMEIIHCKDCLYKKICSWRKEGAEFCSFGERGDSE